MHNCSQTVLAALFLGIVHIEIVVKGQVDHLPRFGLNGLVHHGGTHRDCERLILVLCYLNPFASAHYARIYDFQVNDSCLTCHDREAGMFIHPSVIVIAILHIQLDFLHELGDILETIVLRVLPQHKHTAVHQSDVADAVNEFHTGPLCCPFLVKDLKKGTGRKVAHLITAAYDINIFSEQAVAIPSVCLLCQ